MAIFQLLIETAFWSALSPLVIFPAVALGWWGRSKIIIGAGSLAITLVQLVLLLTTPLPEGAERVIWAVPVLLVPPLAISFGIHWLRSKMQLGPSRPRYSRASRGFLVVFGALLGACAGAGVFFVLALILTEAMNVSAPDGGADYSLLVLGTPLELVIGLIVGARMGCRRSRANLSEGKLVVTATN